MVTNVAKQSIMNLIACSISFLEREGGIAHTCVWTYHPLHVPAPHSQAEIRKQFAVTIEIGAQKSRWKSVLRQQNLASGE